tara:strand:+ start:1079 stop:1300 length:222 start_codon:yes stop_codon:yes gene_type:complete
MTEKTYSIKEFAKILNVHPNTVRNAIKCGRILAFRVGSGKRSIFRILESEFLRMVSVDMQHIIEKIVDSKTSN